MHESPSVCLDQLLLKEVFFLKKESCFSAGRPLVVEDPLHGHFGWVLHWFRILPCSLGEEMVPLKQRLESLAFNMRA